MIDGNIALPHWRLVPAKGTSILKTMLRTRIASDKEAGRTSTAESLRKAALDGPIELSGYMLGAAMLASLEEAIPESVEQLCELSLGADKGSIIGSPLWLRAEPQSDAAMATAIAEELDRWSASCAG